MLHTKSHSIFVILIFHGFSISSYKCVFMYFFHWQRIFMNFPHIFTHKTTILICAVPSQHFHGALQFCMQYTLEIKTLHTKKNLSTLRSHYINVIRSSEFMAHMLPHANKKYYVKWLYESLQTRNKMFSLDAFPAYLLPGFFFFFFYSTHSTQTHNHEA